ncbi:MAG TPA: hypothetical protein VK559_01255 [Ferruginibacter sp.]|nr:hypothetical protein [Ferruginibacter sp.]
MKNIFIAVVLVSFLLSCKKASVPGSKTTLTAAIDGANYSATQQKNFTRIRLPNDSTEFFTLNGLDGAGNYMEIGLESIHNLTTKTYTQTADSTVLVDIYFQGVSSANVFWAVYSSTNPSSITITHIDSVSIAGTFAGTIYDNGDSTTDSKTVTNGTFLLSSQ